MISQLSQSNQSLHRFKIYFFLDKTKYCVNYETKYKRHRNLPLFIQVIHKYTKNSENILKINVKNVNVKMENSLKKYP